MTEKKIIGKEIPGYSGRYSATEDGKVWSVISQKFISFQIKNGYARCSL